MHTDTLVVAEFSLQFFTIYDSYGYKKVVTESCV